MRHAFALVINLHFAEIVFFVDLISPIFICQRNIFTTFLKNKNVQMN